MDNGFDFSRIGQEIKRIRLSKGLSQAVLFDGILSQSAISKIENGDTLHMQVPSLFLIAERLGTDIQHFYDMATTPQSEIAAVLTTQMKEARTLKQYKKLRRHVHRAATHSSFQTNPKLLQLLQWNQALCMYYLDHNYENSIQTLTQAILLTKNPASPYRQPEIHILMDSAAIKLDHGHLNEAYQAYRQCLAYVHILENADYLLKIELFYGLAQASVQLHNYEACVHYSGLGVALCMEHQSFYLLKQLLSLLCQSYENLGDIAQSLALLEVVALFEQLETIHALIK